MSYFRTFIFSDEYVIEGAPIKIEDYLSPFSIKELGEPVDEEEDEEEEGGTDGENE